MSVLGIRIKLLRERAGMNQIDLAKELNVSNTTLSQYESGKRVPSDEIKIKMASFFNVSVDYLLGNEEQKIKATHDGLPLTDEQQELLTATTELNKDELQKALEYVEFLKLKHTTPVLLAARDGGGFDPVESHADEKAQIIKEHPRSKKKLP